MSNPATEAHFGIAQRSFDLIIEAIKARPEIERVVLFGSRAMGNAKHGSDIDLAIAGSGVTEATASALSKELNERLPIPYYVDVVVYDDGLDEAVADHIRTEGRELYRRPLGSP